MTKPALELLKYSENENFGPFHETFLNHIENMGWDNIMTYTVNGVDKNLATQFNEVPTNIVVTFCQNTAALPNTNANGNTLKPNLTYGAFDMEAHYRPFHEK